VERGGDSGFSVTVVHYFCGASALLIFPWGHIGQLYLPPPGFRMVLQGRLFIHLWVRMVGGEKASHTYRARLPAMPPRVRKVFQLGIKKYSAVLERSSFSFVLAKKKYLDAIAVRTIHKPHSRGKCFLLFARNFGGQL
jgi:hypothetical protein